LSGEGCTVANRRESRHRPSAGSPIDLFETRLSMRQRTLCAIAVLLIPLSLTWMAVTSILDGWAFGY
jgi:hypothetical protein